MANKGNNIKQFSAVDIEKYHKGQLSTAEMHAIEKAAMDDPFLADALEGYSTVSTNVTGDISDLKKRLAERTGTAKVVSIESPKRSFQFLRVAVMLLFVAGAALLIYQLGFNKKGNPEIAQAKSIPTTENLSDTVVSSATSTAKDSPGISTNRSTTTIKAPSSVLPSREETAKGNVTTGNVSSNDLPKEKPADNLLRSDNVVSRNNEPQPATVTPPASGAGERSFKAGSDDKTTNKPVSREVGDVNYFKQKDDGTLKDEEIKKSEAAYRKMNAGKNQKQENYSTLGANTFRGQVTDNNRVGVPFANVTNPIDNVGTYTDARGYFNLTYPDSVLNVQVRSIGFENTNVQLRNSVPSNQVVLDNDQRSLSEVVISKQKINTASRSRDNNMKIEEPEPADGWEKYDAYLLNNNNFQEETKKTDNSNGTVMLSFDVNKNGEPTNIKVEKSLCKDCDKEAIRLLKEGPKWKRNAKKGRATIAVPF